MKKSGLFWHIHHDELVEYSEDIQVRIKYIKISKPVNERALRLHLLKPVKGRLPVALTKAQDAYIKALDAYDNTQRAYDKARRAYIKAQNDYMKARDAYNAAQTPCVYDEARDVYDNMWSIYVDAMGVYNDARNDASKAQLAIDKVQKARDSALNRNMPALVKLHKKECKHCPWNGKTIFPKGVA